MLLSGDIHHCLVHWISRDLFFSVFPIIWRVLWKIQMTLSQHSQPVTALKGWFTMEITFTVLITKMVSIISWNCEFSHEFGVIHNWCYTFKGRGSKIWEISFRKYGKHVTQKRGKHHVCDIIYGIPLNNLKFLYVFLEIITVLYKH